MSDNYDFMITIQFSLDSYTAVLIWLTTINIKYTVFPKSYNLTMVSLQSLKIATSSSAFGLAWKMVNTWPKHFLPDPLSITGVFYFLITWTLRKKNKGKKNWFLVNSRCFCFSFHANLMSDIKKNRLKFLFMTPLILLINLSISLFHVINMSTCQIADKDSEFFCYKDNKVM